MLACFWREVLLPRLEHEAALCDDDDGFFLIAEDDARLAVGVNASDVVVTAAAAFAAVLHCQLLYSFFSSAIYFWGFALRW